MELEELQQPVTYSAIGQKICIDTGVWLPYARVRAFVQQHLDSRYLRAIREREQQEELLLPRVEEAFCRLELAGEPVTFKGVGKLLGIDPRKGPYSRRRPIGRSEEEVFSEVQRVILRLTERGMSVNYKAIAHEMGGMTDQKLRTYPKVKRLVDEHLRSYHRYQVQEFALREEQLLRRVEAAFTELEALGKPFTQTEVCEMVGKSRATIRRYPRANALLAQKNTRLHIYERSFVQPAEEELVQKVKEAIIDLSDHGERITKDRVARKVKIHPAVLVQYPQVVVLLEQHGYHKRKPRSERVEELLNFVKDAIKVCKASGQPITKKRLSDMVGVHPSALVHYAEVRTLMTQVATEDKQQRQEHRFQAREQELTQQVITALQQFRDTNRRISKRAIEQAVGVSNMCLYYPNVEALIESALQAQRASTETAVG